MDNLLFFLIFYIFGVALSACAMCVITFFITSVRSLMKLSENEGYKRLLWVSLALMVCSIIVSAVIVSFAGMIAIEYEMGVLGLIVGAAFPGVVILLSSYRLQDYLANRYTGGEAAAKPPAQ